MRIEPIGPFELVPFAIWHLAALEKGEIERKALESGRPAVEAWVGNALTALVDGEPVAIAGIALGENGRAQAWFLGSDRVRRDPITLHRAVSTYLPLIASEMGLESFEVCVHENFKGARKWVERLGFGCVGWASGWFVYRGNPRRFFGLPKREDV